jgi:hypothetical protein
MIGTYIEYYALENLGQENSIYVIKKWGAHTLGTPPPKKKIILLLDFKMLDFYDFFSGLVES